MNFAVNFDEQTPKVDEIFLTESVRDEIKEFIKFAKGKERCVGLAANQCLIDGVLNTKRYFIMKDARGAFHAFINPKITQYSGNKKLMIEGCLSWPDKKISAYRYETIKVSYINLEGEEKEDTLKGIWSQVFQHEYNHLEGIPETILECDHIISEKYGRNDPCYCGSGEKYKKCCGK